MEKVNEPTTSAPIVESSAAPSIPSDEEVTLWVIDFQPAWPIR